MRVPYKMGRKVLRICPALRFFTRDPEGGQIARVFATEWKIKTLVYYLRANPS